MVRLSRPTLIIDQCKYMSQDVLVPVPFATSAVRSSALEHRWTKTLPAADRRLDEFRVRSTPMCTPKEMTTKIITSYLRILGTSEWSDGAWSRAHYGYCMTSTTSTKQSLTPMTCSKQFGSSRTGAKLVVRHSTDSGTLIWQLHFADTQGASRGHTRLNKLFSRVGLNMWSAVVCC